jgi:FkbM family methyltransferase
MIKKLYSQAGQDLWVMQHVFNFMPGGYFLDIGAADGVYFSNTFALEKYLSWKGLCVEANPKTFELLKKNRKCEIVNTCLDYEAGLVKFDVEAGLSGGINLSKGLEINSLTFYDLIYKYNIPQQIDYLNIDVEGAEDRVMATFPFNTHFFHSATIERPSQSLRDTLANNGYILVAELPGLDAFYIHHSRANSYRIIAMELAKTREYNVFDKIFSIFKSLQKNGIRHILRRL